MNRDEFEKQLERQPMRAIPREWREEILKSAQTAAHDQPSSPNLQPQPWWRVLLWPCPQAWAALAAAWLVIFGLHLIAGLEPRSAARLTALQPSPEYLAVLAEQRKLYAELLPPPEPSPTSRRRQPAEGPRSKRDWQPGLPTAQSLELPLDHLLV